MERQCIRARIREIAANPKAVRLDEIVSLLDNHIGPLFRNYSHRGGNHHAFTVGDQTFNIPRPHSGCVKRSYIMNFLEAMEMVELYDPEES